MGQFNPSRRKEGINNFQPSQKPWLKKFWKSKLPLKFQKATIENFRNFAWFLVRIPRNP